MGIAVLFRCSERPSASLCQLCSRLEPSPLGLVNVNRISECSGPMADILIQPPTVQGTSEISKTRGSQVPKCSTRIGTPLTCGSVSIIVELYDVLPVTNKTTVSMQTSRMSTRHCPAWAQANLRQLHAVITLSTNTDLDANS